MVAFVYNNMRNLARQLRRHLVERLEQAEDKLRLLQSLQQVNEGSAADQHTPDVKPALDCTLTKLDSGNPFVRKCARNLA
jgi:hypothetical protein